MTGLAKPTMSIHLMASPTVCLVSIEVSSLTVTSDCSCLVIIILFFSGHAIGIANLRNRTTFSHQTSLIYGPLSDDVHKTILVSIQITVLDLEPNPDFRTFLVISKTYHRICKCDTSKRRSGQEIPFVFFELRAPTCLWGRYDPKTENFTLFCIYLLHINSFSKTFYILV